METEEHIAAARKATRLMNAPFLTVLMEGKYPAEYLEKEGANAPKVEPGDLEKISSPLDFVGLNVYTPSYVRASDKPEGFELEQVPASYPKMFSPWIQISPECIYWAVRNVCDLWKPKEIYITENGTSSDDVLTPEGHVEDTDRVMYLRNHLTMLHRAVKEEYPVKGYFLWSLLDNFEWADDVDHVEVAFFNEAVPVGVEEVEARRCAPMTEKARLDVVECERTFKERIVFEVDLADGEVVGGAEVGVDLLELIRGERA
jgi:beta-glucosidase/6-phospho-beta-glucosidase/beta-galactosidase